MPRSTIRKIGLLISIVSLFVSVVVSIFFTPYFIEKVGDRQYGIYSFVTSLVAWLNMLTICLASGYNKFSTEYKKTFGQKGENHVNNTFRKIYLFADFALLFLGTFLWIFFKLGFVPLINYSPAEQILISNLLLISLISILTTVPFTLSNSYPYYKEKYIFTNLLPLITTILQTLISFILLFRGYSVFSVCITHCAVSVAVIFIQVIYSHFVLKMESNPLIDSGQKSKDKKLLKSILVFSSFIIINTIIEVMDRSSSLTILGFINPSHVTVFQLAASFRGYLLVMAQAVSTIFVKEMYDANVSSDSNKQVNEVFQKTSKYIITIVFFAIGGFVACGRDFVVSWIGVEKENVFYLALIILIVWSVPLGFLPANDARRAKNKHMISSYVLLGTALLNIVISIFFVKIFPNEDAVWACIMGTTISVVLGRWIVLPITDYKYVNLDIKRFYLSTLKFALYAFVASFPVMIVFTYVVELSFPSLWINVFIEAFFFVGLYVLQIFLFEKALLKQVFSFRHIFTKQPSRDENR